MKKLALFLSLVLIVTMLAVPAMAVEFTPSVESKGAPSIVAVVDQTGASVAAIIRDAQGQEVIGVPFGELIVTPVSEADEAVEVIKDPLLRAYVQIQAAGSLMELTPDMEQAVRRYDSEVDVSDLVVRDLFDVSVFGTYADYLAVEGNTITVRFDLHLDSSDLLLVLHNYSGSDWEVLSEDRVVRNADGTVDVTFDSLSPIAFVVDGSEVEVDPNGPTSPQTGDSGLPVAWIAVAVLGCAAAAGVVLLRKKHA